MAPHSSARPGAAQLPSPAPLRLVIYSYLFLKLFWESVKTEPGAGASPLESFCSRQDSALDNSGTRRGWWQGWSGTSVSGEEGKKKNFPSLPSLPLPLQDMKNSWKALGGGKGSRTLMWTQGKGEAGASTWPGVGYL